jgi:hypothetical protein
VLESEQLTVGTPDANGQAPNSAGFVKTQVAIGDPGTPADEADVQVTMNLTDVRRRDTLADYDGRMLARVSQRTTDRYNGNSQSESATMTDVPLEVPVQCTATADPASGATCSVTTTLDALLPGTVRESARAVVQLGKVDVLDGGADDNVETAADNQRFATQGLFVP